MQSEQQDDLSVGIFQMDLKWENPQDNLNKIENILKDNFSKLDVLVLPEMFTTGFSMKSEHLAWTFNHPEYKKLQAYSQQYQCSIIGSVWFKENDKFYNRCFHWNANGHVEYYDKIHTFSLVKEDAYITKGKTQTVFTVRNWKIKPQICYDLRFPKGVYNQSDNPYDVLLYVANWPEKRIQAWDILLKARAVENQSYVLGVNRVGTEPNNVHYSGHSVAIDYTGKVIGEMSDYKEEILIIELVKRPQMEFRKRFPFIMDEI